MEAVRMGMTNAWSSSVDAATNPQMRKAKSTGFLVTPEGVPGVRKLLISRK